MIETKTYGIRRTVSLAYDVALAKVRRALQDQGFGVLCEIDIREKLKEKLGVDFKRYTILGACNPPLAFKALQVENDLGLLLPCNVIVYETSANESVVAAIDPDSMVAITENDALRAIADDAKIRLEKVIGSI